MFKINRRKIEIERAKKGLTQKELVKLAKIGPLTLKADKLSPLSVGKIANALNVDVEELIIDEDVE